MCLAFFFKVNIYVETSFFFFFLHFYPLFIASAGYFSVYSEPNGVGVNSLPACWELFLGFFRQNGKKNMYLAALPLPVATVAASRGPTFLRSRWEYSGCARLPAASDAEVSAAWIQSAGKAKRCFLCLLARTQKCRPSCTSSVSSLVHRLFSANAPCDRCPSSTMKGVGYKGVGAFFSPKYLDVLWRGGDLTLDYCTSTSFVVPHSLSGWILMNSINSIRRPTLSEAERSFSSSEAFYLFFFFFKHKLITGFKIN